VSKLGGILKAGTWIRPNARIKTRARTMTHNVFGAHPATAAGLGCDKVPPRRLGCAEAARLANAASSQ
jgi:hypothetical protein